MLLQENTADHSCPISSLPSLSTLDCFFFHYYMINKCISMVKLHYRPYLTHGTQTSYVELVLLYWNVNQWITLFLAVGVAHKTITPTSIIVEFRPHSCLDFQITVAHNAHNENVIEKHLRFFSSNHKVSVKAAHLDTSCVWGVTGHYILFCACLKETRSNVEGLYFLNEHWRGAHRLLAGMSRWWKFHVPVVGASITRGQPKSTFSQSGTHFIYIGGMMGLVDPQTRFELKPLIVSHSLYYCATLNLTVNNTTFMLLCE